MRQNFNPFLLFILLLDIYICHPVLLRIWVGGQGTDATCVRKEFPKLRLEKKWGKRFFFGGKLCEIVAPLVGKSDLDLVV